jgi:hypothetical protein
MIQRPTKPPHPIYIYNFENKMLKSNSGSHNDKNVDLNDNAMLPYA